MRVLLLVAVLLACAPLPARPQPAAATRSDTGFAALVERLSEPGAYFDTDNLISNEASYLHVVGGLRAAGVRGGAYLGVGPGQNFSYIAHVRPRIAILVDIRRDNLLQHLLYKAIFELSRDRAHYLGLLTARPVAPAGATEEVESIVRRIDAAPVRPQLFDSVHALVQRRLGTSGIPLSREDRATIRRFHQAFARDGLDLRFQSHGRPPQPYYPTLRQLLLARDLEGRPASYLAREEDFRFVRSLQEADRIIPVVGDLAGRTALPEIARFLRERGDRVTAYYTSNVEYYLLGEGKLEAFVGNVRALPRDPRGVVIRSAFRTRLPQTVPGFASTQLLQPLDSLVAAYDAGRIRSYRELVTVGSLPLR